jgi:single-strand DNA-binding protein
MSRNNTIEATVRGRVVTPPTLHTGASGTEFASFRLAATPRVFDRGAGEWVDGETEWISVAVFGQAFVLHVVKSVHKGQPVIVTGTLTSSAWLDREGEIRSELRLRAQAMGHDLFWGRSDFFRVADATVAQRPEQDDPEHPGDDGAEPRPAPVPAAASDVNTSGEGWAVLGDAA